MTLINLTGKVFGRLTVIGRDPAESKAAKWLCVCQCGNHSSVLSQNLRRGKIVSCGCYRAEKAAQAKSHGKTKSAEYRIWQGMLNRCRNENVKGFERYGGRGIRVCERWQSFENFLQDLGERPSPTHSLERKNADGDYEPNNVVWATVVTQANNKRNTRTVLYRGKVMPLAEAVRMAGSIVHIEAANIRIKSGWDVATALETPTQKRTRAPRPR